MKKLTLIGIVILMGGCASIERSTLLGAGIGAAVGTGFGLAVHPNAPSALLGGGIGAAFGAGMGYVGGKDREEKEQKEKLKFSAGLKEKSKGEKEKDIPFIKAPEAHCATIEEHIDGDTYYGPQLKCTITKGASWAR